MPDLCHGAMKGGRSLLLTKIGSERAMSGPLLCKQGVLVLLSIIFTYVNFLSSRGVFMLRWDVEVCEECI